MELKSTTSLKTIEEKSDELGMDKLDKHQIEYFSLTDGDKAEIVDPEKSAGIFSQIAVFFTNLFGGFVEEFVVISLLCNRQIILKPLVLKRFMFQFES